jgi:hypothetical protein
MYIAFQGMLFSSPTEVKLYKNSELFLEKQMLSTHPSD